MKDISKFEGIAMLELGESDRQRLEELADTIIDNFDALEKIDTNDVKPLVSVLETINVLREDIVIKNVSRDELMTRAPEHNDGYYQVPATIE
ncbi:MAG: Asp-tRNA(Asn)/Glu-tRNA(Gln) amidotransferase subunit GatC [Oscillospiraceae bacterium]|nr:Asp-tRNA(Asn)/Glu-tRNA(Gln) amidotransferase subunit GatC [Oscillospiraceae bacterium]